jgi:hypothetical protein
MLALNICVRIFVPLLPRSRPSTDKRILQYFSFKTIIKMSVVIFLLKYNVMP